MSDSIIISPCHPDRAKRVEGSAASVLGLNEIFRLRTASSAQDDTTMKDAAQRIAASSFGFQVQFHGAMVRAEDSGVDFRPGESAVKPFGRNEIIDTPACVLFTGPETV